MSDLRTVDELLTEGTVTLSPEMQAAIREAWDGRFLSKLNDRTLRLEFANDGRFNYGQCRSIGHSPVNGQTAWGDMSGGPSKNGQNFGVYYEFWIDDPDRRLSPIKRLYAWWPKVDDTRKDAALVRYEQGVGAVRVLPFRRDDVFYARLMEQLRSLGVGVSVKLDGVRRKITT